MINCRYSRGNSEQLCVAVIYGLLLFHPIIVNAAEQDISIVDIEYTKIKSQRAINIRFDQAIRYKTHFPTRQGRRLTIQLDLIKPLDSKSDFQNKLTPPPSKRIPLSLLSLVVEDSQPAVILQFSKSVTFRVSQISATDTVSVILSDQPGPEKSLIPLAEIKDEKSDQPNNAFAEKIFLAGRQALKEGKNKLAIRIFTKVLSLPKHRYLQDALELLGVSRERNQQYAQAKLIYRHYLKKYTTGDKHDRVKQRLGDLMAGTIKPKARLKTLKKSAKRALKVRRSFTGLLQQNYFLAQNSFEGSSSVSNESFLSNQLSANWRVREAATDIRHFIFVSYDYDQELDISGEFKINTLYSKYKNSDYGLYATVGRQSSASGGVLGRFDGVYLGYDFSPAAKMTVSVGSPLDFLRKDRIQKEKIFTAISIELDELVKDWFIAPYYVEQKNRGIEDRRAVGLELRYYAKRGNLFNVIDYDTLFSELNIYTARGQYHLSDNTSLNISVDKRRSPLLEVSSALIGNIDTTVSTIDELAGKISQQELFDRALGRTGESTISSFGLTHKIGNDWQVSSDFTVAKSSFKSVLADGINTISIRDNQHFFNVQLVRYKLFQPADTLILSMRQSTTDNYDETLLSVSHRLIFSTFRLQTRFRASTRESESGTTKRLKPSVIVDYRKYKNVNLHLNLSVEGWNTSNVDFTRTSIDLGYQWNF